jgi:hypothetical protein
MKKKLENNLEKIYSGFLLSESFEVAVSLMNNYNMIFGELDVNYMYFELMDFYCYNKKYLC